ncbi:hypothetical protein [uncultured Methylovirgula sp.]|uniref:hypothetical protein n=1 Tax=uncultured Methylovirgula sp. TaxID=1285960 RepID=UPI00261E21F7|nr:hypothetical protein [uncultured Methylovirgula sp.]
MKICCVISRTRDGRVKIVESAARLTIYGTVDQIGTPEKLAAAIIKFREGKR